MEGHEARITLTIIVTANDLVKGGELLWGKLRFVSIANIEYLRHMLLASCEYRCDAAVGMAASACADKSPKKQAVNGVSGGLQCA